MCRHIFGGMPYRPPDGPEKYRDKEWLESKYWDERLSTSDIADLCDRTKETIRRWMDRHEIPKRDPSERVKLQWEDNPERRREIGELFAKHNRTLHPFFFTDYEGYERAGSSDGNGGSVFVKIHRLLAIANGADPHEIFSAKKVVHHESRTPWDNRPRNLQVLTPSDHSRLHAKAGENGRASSK